VENYEKGEVKELEDHVQMQCLHENAIHMNVNTGSKIHNVMKFAERKMNVRLKYFFFYFSYFTWLLTVVVDEYQVYVVVSTFSTLGELKCGQLQFFF